MNFLPWGKKDCSKSEYSSDTINQYEPELTTEKRKEEYPILYYQFIKYAFGLVFAEDKEVILLYLDEIPLSQEDKTKFVAHLYSLNNDHDFKA